MPLDVNVVMITVFGTFPWNATQQKEGVSTLRDKRAEEKSSACMCWRDLRRQTLMAFGTSFRQALAEPLVHITPLLLPLPALSLAPSCIIAAWSCSRSSELTNAGSAHSEFNHYWKAVSISSSLLVFYSVTPPNLFCSYTLSLLLMAAQSSTFPFSLSLPRHIVLFDSVGVHVHVHNGWQEHQLPAASLYNSLALAYTNTHKRGKEGVCAREWKRRDCKETKENRTKKWRI